MKNLLLIYLLVQLLSTAYGLAVIETVKPIVKQKLADNGYTKMNKNSLYNFSNRITNILKALIPGYYAFKAVSLVRGSDPITRAYNEEITSGNYITYEEEQRLKMLEEQNKNEYKPVIEPEIIFEKPDKYVARKNDVSLYDTYETPIEYITREATREDNLSITPFQGEDAVVKPVVVKEEVTNSDIAKAISSLSAEELELLNEKITYLAEIRKNNHVLSLDRDVA